jgi:Uncharacterized conserved protein containing a ferredoxin-like domain
MDIEKLRVNLKSRGIDMSYFETAEEAVAYLTDALKGKTVGIGGSMTVDAIGLYDELVKGSKVAWHWKQDPDEARDEATNAEAYVSSVNGISETGEIVNIDGAGNRVAATVYPTKEVYYVIGVNKIRPTLEEALWRARNIASPLNARRLNCKTPCAQGELKCWDCRTEGRICREILITCGKPLPMKKMEVVVINSELGF